MRLCEWYPVDALCCARASQQGPRDDRGGLAERARRSRSVGARCRQGVECAASADTSRTHRRGRRCELDDRDNERGSQQQVRGRVSGVGACVIAIA
jgi:hypothetical protein